LIATTDCPPRWIGHGTRRERDDHGGLPIATKDFPPRWIATPTRRERDGYPTRFLAKALVG